jgi:hypothetical protein
MWRQLSARRRGAPVNFVSLGLEVPTPLRFNVFGKIMLAEKLGEGWRLLVLGVDGKRSLAGVVIPDFIQEHEVGQYLDDIFHEMATLESPNVIQLSP